MIDFTCDCGNALRADDDERGKSIACPVCGKRQPVPYGKDRVTAEPAPGRRDYYEEDQPRRRRFEAEPDDRPRVGQPPKSHALLYTMIALGVCALVGCVILIPLALLFPAIWKIREAAERMTTTNNMMQISLAMQNYHDSYGQLPLAYTLIDAPPGQRQPSMSWRVALLPYLEEDKLYQQFNPQEPWDGPTNRMLNSQQLRVYQFPKDPPSNQIYFQVFVTAPGRFTHAMFNHPTDPRNKIKLSDVTDGTANTIMIAEATTPVAWMSPQDLPFDPDQPPPPLGSHFKQGAIVGMGDASVRFVPPTMSPVTLKALITRDGGEVVNPNW
jgi:hypothetical protein